MERVMSQSTAPPDTLEDRVERWIADDPDPTSRAELRALLDAGEEAELAERFAGPLAFGTAGLRGPLGAGPARMNVATVRQASGGLARYLLDRVPGAAAAGVAIGHDARHGSAEFADATAAVLEGAGIRALRVPGRLPTPVLAFAVRELGAAAGVMVTASHNPPQDNGYKVYLATGAQIAPPVDAEIAARIAAVGPLADQPLGGLGAPVGERVLEDYLRMAAATPSSSGRRDVRIAYTPMHGVGGAVALEAFRRAGFPAPAVVAEQFAPDPDFPTVERPNPEEPGAMDRVIALGEATGADLVLATDPDADRLAVAVPAPGGGFRRLTGDEVGALLAVHRLRGIAEPGRALLVSTVASSSLLARIAEAAGAEHVETLTGFKWIMRAVLERPRKRLALGYEEALGYAVTDAVRDKDGITAALVMAELAAEARQEGATVLDRLDDLARAHGLHATDQLTLELPGAAGIERRAELMDRLRATPPRELAGEPVVATDDLMAGVRRHRDGREQGLGFHAADVVVLHGEAAARVVVRPSGTEPKLKAYLQVVVPVAEGDVAAARARAAARLAELRAALAELLR
jgi:phosphomannomutase